MGDKIKESALLDLEDIQKQILELNQKTNSSTKYDHPPLTFDPPKLPYAWLATTFIAPALIVILPYILDAGKESLQTLVIVALSLMVILSLAMVFITHARLYDAYYKTQIHEYRLAELSEVSEEMRIKNIETVNIVNKSYEVLKRRCETLPTDSESANTQRGIDI